jgi:intracellular sulfur oxidation DsrE/DsrF family protein
MKNYQLLPIVVFSFLSLNLSAQQKQTDPKSFHGAVATAKHYKAVYQLNTDDDKKIMGTLKNISNALEDPRLKGKLELELVVHGGGVAAFKKGSAYEQQLLALQKAGVILAECENTLRERNISKDELFDFISFVPSGNGELIIRQQQGWAIIHP